MAPPLSMFVWWTENRKSCGGSICEISLGDRLRYDSAMKRGIRLTLLFAMFSFLIFMHGDKAVLAASPDLANGHFQMMAAVVDELNGEGNSIPTHEVFLLDTDAGKVWKFQGTVWTGSNQNGKSKIIYPEMFVSIPVNKPAQ